MDTLRKKIRLKNSHRYIIAATDTADKADADKADADKADADKADANADTNADADDGIDADANA